jgi:adenylate kinase
MKFRHYLKTAIATLALLSIGLPTITHAESGDGPYIVMIGTPAAGKSVNSELLSKAYDIPWVNIREELMKEIKKDAKKSKSTAATRHKRGAASSKRRQAMKQAVAKLEAGELVNGDSLNALIATEVLSSGARGGFILDGYPMTVEQAEFLDSLLELRGMRPLYVIYLNIPDEVSMQRMKERGREDDKRDIGKERLRVFRSMIGPLAEYYGESLTEIDATQSKSAISTELVRLLGD